VDSFQKPEIAAAELELINQQADDFLKGFVNRDAAGFPLLFHLGFLSFLKRIAA
jgi:hypothetical protein